MIQNKNIKLILNYFGGPLVFCALAYSIHYQLSRQPDWHSSLARLWSSITTASLFPVCGVIFLMFVNWSIEARKWQLSLRNKIEVPFLTCLRAVFAGNALALFTPNRTGEYFGRMLVLPKNARLSSVPVTIVCSIAQLIVTLLAGSIALYIMRDDILSCFGSSRSLSFWFDMILCSCIIIMLLLTFSYFRVRFVSMWVGGIKKFRSLHKTLRVLEGFNATILLSILSLSVIRYIVFIVQYFMLFRIFGVELNWWQAFWAVSVVFIAIAVIPATGVLSEVGVRWQTSMHLLQVYSSNITGIFATSLAVWLINLVIPAIAGGVFILALKLFAQQDETINLIVEENPTGIK